MIKIDLLKNHQNTIPTLANIWHEVLGKIWNQFESDFEYDPYAILSLSIIFTALIKENSSRI